MGKLIFAVDNEEDSRKGAMHEMWLERPTVFAD